MPNIGPMELIIVLVIALIVFGPKRLPDLGRSVGRGMREFREGIAGHDESARPTAGPSLYEPMAERDAEAGVETDTEPAAR
jgi:sec-independent protein translocase protein TatA